MFPISWKKFKAHGVVGSGEGRQRCWVGATFEKFRVECHLEIRGCLRENQQLRSEYYQSRC